MNTSLLAATVFVTACAASSASALMVGMERTLRVDGLDATLGTVSFFALGVNGGFCEYLMNWSGPYNPNGVNMCFAHELRTAFDPSCILNERADILTTITVGVAETCTGSNLKSEDVEAKLVLAEGPLGVTGVAVLGAGFPAVYPVTLAISCGDDDCDIDDIDDLIDHD